MIEQLELDLFLEDDLTSDNHNAFYLAKCLNSNLIKDESVLIACDGQYNLLLDDCVIDESTGQLFAIQKRQWAVSERETIYASTKPTGYDLEEYLISKFQPVSMELRIQFPVQFNKKEG